MLLFKIPTALYEATRVAIGKNYSRAVRSSMVSYITLRSFTGNSLIVVRRGEKYVYLRNMSFDARVLCPPEMYIAQLRSSAAHAISISCMRAIVCSIRFAREMPRLEQKVKEVKVGLKRFRL